MSSSSSSSDESDVIDVDDSNDDVCDFNWRRCGFGVRRVKSCVGRGLPPALSRSGNDLEYFSSDADRLSNFQFKISNDN